MSYIYEGIGRPKIIFDNGLSHTLPEPNGSGKEGLRIYDFEPFSRETYWSEGDKKVRIGKKFIFSASLSWLSLNKLSLKYLWNAQKQSSFLFILNVDKAEIVFRVEVSGLTYKFFKGVINSPGGYSVNLKLTGTELLNSAGYTGILSSDGYGTDWGADPENQSP